MNENKEYIELDSVITTLKGFAFKSEDYIESGTPVIRVSDFTENSISVSENVYFSKERAIQYSKYQLTYGDILIQTVGSWPSNPASVVGKVVRVPIELLGSLLNQNIVKIIPKKSIEKKFLYYLLKDETFKNYIVNCAQGAASQASITLDAIKKFKFILPDISIQHRIATILSAYDDLIENNNRRIALLEQMAEQIYKEWFVRMRFPGYENTEFEKGVPKGWEVTCYSELVEFRKGRNITADTVIQGSVPVVAGGLEPAYYHNTANTNSPTITISASGANAGYVNLYYDNIWASDCSFLDSKTTKCIFYHYLHLKTRQTEVYFLQKGSAQPHVYPKDLMSMKILKPQIDLIEIFNGLIKPFLKEFKTLKTQSQNLKQTRDRLLPRLISGKLRVKDVEKEMEKIV